MAASLELIVSATVTSRLLETYKLLNFEHVKFVAPDDSPGDAAGKAL